LFAPKYDETLDARELEKDDPFANIACGDAMVDGIDLEDNGVEVGGLTVAFWRTALLVSLCKRNKIRGVSSGWPVNVSIVKCHP
jgi:hypothetical protein